MTCCGRTTFILTRRYPKPDYKKLVTTLPETNMPCIMSGPRALRLEGNFGVMSCLQWIFSTSTSFTRWQESCVLRLVCCSSLSVYVAVGAPSLWCGDVCRSHLVLSLPPRSSTPRNSRPAVSRERRQSHKWIRLTSKIYDWRATWSRLGETKWLTPTSQ